MSEFAFQQALVRLLTDTKARHSFFKGDVQVMAEFGLPLEEAQRILAIDPERLEVFADMLTGQRLNDAAQMLPLTAQLLGSRLHYIAYEFNQEITPRYSTKFEHALAFARFLKKQFGEEPPSPAFAEDVLTYEMTALELFGKRDETDFAQTADLKEQLHEAEAQTKIVPSRQPTHQVLTFNYDVAEIAAELKEGRIPTSPLRQPLNILLRVNAVGLIEQDRINYPTLAFIEACDGATPLSEVIEDLASIFEQNTPKLRADFQQKCLNLCEALVERGVITLRLSVPEAYA